MSQPWMQVAGLAMDFLGVALIALEWLLAQRQERTARAIEEAEARQREGMVYMQRAQASMSPHATAAVERHHEMMSDSQRRITQAKLGGVRRHYGGLRHSVVYAGMILVSLGFLTQIVAAWPGCCPQLGIVPVG